MSKDRTIKDEGTDKVKEDKKTFLHFLKKKNVSAVTYMFTYVKLSSALFSKILQSDP